MQKQVISYLDTIEKQISIIEGSKSLETIQQAVGEIRKCADAIYNDTKKSDPTFPNTLKRIILKWIEPVQIILDKQLPDTNPGSTTSALDQPIQKFSSEELAIKTKLLYTEQSAIKRQPLLNEAPLFHKNLALIRVQSMDMMAISQH